MGLQLAPGWSVVSTRRSVLEPLIAILALILFGPALLAEDIALLEDPWHIGPGAIARVTLKVLRLMF